MYKRANVSSFYVLSTIASDVQLSPNFSKPLWDVIAFTISKVPLPTPGKDRVLFAIENSLLSVEVPPKEGLPHADVGTKLPTFACDCCTIWRSN